MKNIERFAKHIAKNGPDSILAHDIPETGNWIVCQKIENDKWELTLCNSTGSVAYPLGFTDDESHLALWNQLVADYGHEKLDGGLSKELPNYPLSQETEESEPKTRWVHEKTNMPKVNTVPDTQHSVYVHRRVNSQKEKSLLWYGIVLWIVIPLLLYFVISMWYFSATTKPDDGCRRTTKQQQVITKLDGDVNSVSTEDITGLLCPDGSFYPDP